MDRPFQISKNSKIKITLQPSISVHRKKFLANTFLLINYKLKTPSAEMACLLDIQNEIQAVVCQKLGTILENNKTKSSSIDIFK
jgi:hypothetical protein